MLLWKLIPNTPDYEIASFIAVYQKTVKGYASYYTFRKDLPKSKRSIRTAVCIGGLPESLRGLGL